MPFLIDKLKKYKIQISQIWDVKMTPLAGRKLIRQFRYLDSFIGFEHVNLFGIGLFLCPLLMYSNGYLEEFP